MRKRGSKHKRPVAPRIVARYARDDGPFSSKQGRAIRSLQPSGRMTVKDNLF